MKHFFTAIVALVAFSSVSFASNSYSVLTKLNDEKVFRGVARYLGTTAEQDEKLKFVFDESSKKLKKDSAKAMSFNLGNVRAVLTTEQYKKYLMILNISVAKESANELMAGK